MSNYYRQPVSFFGVSIAPVTRNLLVANVVVYALQVLFLNRFLDYVALVPAYALGKGMVWQFATYMFLHWGFFHLLFNMFLLWMFGSEIERYWGSGEFLKYYFVTGVGGGVLSCVFSPGSFIPIVGASGAIFGLLLAYGMAFPDRQIYIYFLVPIRAKYLVLILGAIELLAVASPGGDGIARFAHLGGLLFGFLYIKRERFGFALRRRWGRLTRNRRVKLVRPDWKRREGKEGEDADRDGADRKDPGRIDREQRGDPDEEEVNAILDKINRSGMGSLTDREKETLRRASDRRRLH
ncbi:MAG: rhomboid family intramembrane serine protease [Candidatus Eisenbacteria bacterium]|nr:rhomboid family intramembrane serine protease [Candidatus Eisenbacteria bacterium]